MTLADYLVANGISLGTFGRRIGERLAMDRPPSRATVYRWCQAQGRKDRRVPAPRFMTAIGAETGGQVTANDFYHPSKESAG